LTFEPSLSISRSPATTSIATLELGGIKAGPSAASCAIGRQLAVPPTEVVNG
jgi:hypothetical protein